MDKLTPKQKEFADNYIISGNATEAAIKAGYSQKNARQIGSENLTGSIMIKSRAAMYADTRRMTYAYYDKIGNYIKTLPEDDVQYIIAEVVKTLDLGTGNEGINLLAAPKCEPASDSGTAIIRLEAERDIYKGLYESLLEKAVKPV